VQRGRPTPGKLHANSCRPRSDPAVAFFEAKEGQQAGSIMGKTGRASWRRVVARSARDEARVLLEGEQGRRKGSMHSYCNIRSSKIIPPLSDHLDECRC
jgi:hypothetical protein